MYAHAQSLGYAQRFQCRECGQTANLDANEFETSPYSLDAQARRCEQELGPTIEKKPFLFDIRKTGTYCVRFVSVTVDQEARVIAKEIALPDLIRHSVIRLPGAEDARFGEKHFKQSHRSLPHENSELRLILAR